MIYHSIQRNNGRSSILGCLLGSKVQVIPLAWEACSLSWRYLEHLSCSINSGLLCYGGLPHNAVSKTEFLGKPMLSGEYTVQRLLSHWDLIPTECPLCSWATYHSVAKWIHIMLHIRFCPFVLVFFFSIVLLICFTFLSYLPIPSLSFILLPSSASHTILPRVRKNIRSMI